jgi:uncharacterized protein YbjT (DUF2867 family)
MHGQVHRYLMQNMPSWIVLRPSWFMQNFSELQHRETIRRNRKICSATGDGKIPWIDAADIAAVAVEALTDPAFVSGDPILTGPELLSYNDVASIISSVSGYTVTHWRLSEEETIQSFRKIGIPDEYGAFLAALDTRIAHGAEQRLTGEVERITGKVPGSFCEFAYETREAWTRE